MRFLRKRQTLVNRFLNTFFSKNRPWGLYSILILLPLVSTLLLVRGIFQTNLTHFHVGWSDELIYRQEILTYKEVGFIGGYFSTDEQIAKSTFSHFGNHGPVFAVVYGSLGRILGFKEYSGPLFNIGIVCLSILLFLWIVKPNRKQSLFLLFVAGLNIPLTLYLPTLMQEGINQAVAILLAAFFVRLTRNDKVSTGLKIFALITLSFGALLRITWIVAAFPLFFFFRQERTKKWFVISTILALVFSAVMYMIYAYWTSPYTEGFLYGLLKQPTLTLMVKVLLARILQNFLSLIRLKTENQELATLFHYQLLAVILIFILFWKKNKSLIIANIFMLASSIMITMAFYVIGYWGDYRTLSPLLLISIVSLVFIMDDSKMLNGFVILLVLSNLVATPWFIRTYEAFHIDHFGTNHDPSAETIGIALSKLEYRENESPWCNSLFTNHGPYEEIRYLSPGIGLNALLQRDALYSKVNSHYLFVPQTFLDLNRLTKKCEPLFSLNGDVLCYMKGDGCEQ